MSSRSERFKKLYPKRLEKAVWSIQSIGKLSNRSNYVYEDEEVDNILSTLMFELKAAISKFGKGTVEERFKRYLEIDLKQMKVINESDPELYNYIIEKINTSQGNLLEKYLKESDKEKKEKPTSTLEPQEMLLTKKEFNERFGKFSDLSTTINNTEKILIDFYLKSTEKQRELGKQLETLQNTLQDQEK